MHPAIAPGFTELVRGHRNRRETAGGLGLEKTETGFHLSRSQGPQTDVVELQHQAHMLQGLLCRAAHGDIVEQHGELALEIDAVGFAGQGDVRTRPKEVVAGALVDQRRVLDALDRLQVEGLLHQFAVAEEAGAVQPLAGARQGRG
ncbi:hypothetical protein D3C80_1684640 [compost metagenome]